MDRLEFELQYSLQSKKAGSEVMFFSEKLRRPNEEGLLKVLGE